MADNEATFDVPIGEVEGFVADRYGARASGAVEPAGNGSWSRCFGFALDGTAVVLKVSPHDDDLTLDRVAAGFAGRGLPVPQILDHGDGLGMHFTVAERVPGTPLEYVSADEWVSVVPSVADALEAMRDRFADHGSGWGGWDARGVASHGGWRDFLLATLVDRPGERVSGWLAKLDGVPELRAAFDTAQHAIDRLATDDVPRGLLHCDLLYRNVHVHDGRLAGIFDWGCSNYGDPLMELGWFEFWGPWYPQLDTSLLLDEMARRSPAADVAAFRDRWLTVLLHIGATHIAYQAFADLWDDAHATARRMVALSAGLGLDL